MFPSSRSTDCVLTTRASFRSPEKVRSAKGAAPYANANSLGCPERWASDEDQTEIGLRKAPQLATSVGRYEWQTFIRQSFQNIFETKFPLESA
jgi:hypothetical protein